MRRSRLETSARSIRLSSSGSPKVRHHAASAGWADTRGSTAVRATGGSTGAWYLGPTAQALRVRAEAASIRIRGRLMGKLGFG